MRHGKTTINDLYFNVMPGFPQVMPWRPNLIVQEIPDQPWVSITDGFTTNSCLLLNIVNNDTEIRLDDPALPVGTRFILINKIESSRTVSYAPYETLVTSSPGAYYLAPGEKAEIIKISEYQWYIDKPVTKAAPFNPSMPFTALYFNFQDPMTETVLAIDATNDKKFRFDISGAAFLDFPNGLQDGDELTFMFRRTLDIYWMNFDSRYRWDTDVNGFQFHPDTLVYHLVTAVYESSSGILMCRMSKYLPPGYGY